jgi:phosphorylated CTD-interacting factor 1
MFCSDDPPTFAVTIAHFERLEADYERCCGVSLADSAQRVQFQRRLLCLLLRYHTIGGIGYQMAIPEKAFDVLKSEFAVSHECFASPFNRYLPSFTSGFPDVDRFFGSKGSFFDFYPQEGSFEANPPFLEEIMAAMALHLCSLLERAQQTGKALAFVVIMSGWNDTPAYVTMRESRFCRLDKVFRKKGHLYKVGNQHVNRYQYMPAGADSFVLFLQSDEAFRRWEPTERRVRLFEESFRSPCFHFLKFGSCRNGRDCQFSHEPVSAKERESFMRDREPRPRAT